MWGGAADAAVGRRVGEGVRGVGCCLCAWCPVRRVYSCVGPPEGPLVVRREKKYQEARLYSTKLPLFSYSYTRRNPTLRYSTYTATTMVRWERGITSLRWYDLCVGTDAVVMGLTYAHVTR